MLGPVVRALGGQIATAPADVFFFGANPVQPDILAMLPGSRAVGGGRGIQGPPDLVIEVLSPSNRTHDLLTKRALYARGGVQEYWIVDPAARTVDVLVLDRDAFHTAQGAAGTDVITSPRLEGASFPFSAVFANVEADEA
jgi:Uma2 family endonuclease